MTCRECFREVPLHASGICVQCTPRPTTKWGIHQDDGYWLQFNAALQIMETTPDRRYAAVWASEDLAKHAAAYYELMFGSLSVRAL